MASTVKSLFGGGYHVEDPPLAEISAGGGPPSNSGVEPGVLPVPVVVQAAVRRVALHVFCIFQRLKFLGNAI